MTNTQTQLEQIVRIANDHANTMDCNVKVVAKDKNALHITLHYKQGDIAPKTARIALRSLAPASS